MSYSNISSRILAPDFCVRLPAASISPAGSVASDGFLVSRKVTDLAKRSHEY